MHILSEGVRDLNFWPMSSFNEEIMFAEFPVAIRSRYDMTTHRVAEAGRSEVHENFSEVRRTCPVC